MERKLAKVDHSDTSIDFRLMEQELAEVPLPEEEQPFVARELEAKAKLFTERHAVYGDNYFRFGPIMSLILETQTLDVKSASDMARLGVLVQIVSKITRYGENFNRGGHDDSLDDIAVYAMMLKCLDHKQ